MTDAFTRYTILKATRSNKSRPVLPFLEEIASVFGSPSTIISDRVIAFTVNAFESYCEQHSIRHIKNAFRTPRANGLVERQNANVLNALKSMTKREDGLAMEHKHDDERHHQAQLTRIAVQLFTAIHYAEHVVECLA